MLPTTPLRSTRNWSHATSSPTSAVEVKSNEKKRALLAIEIVVGSWDEAIPGSIAHAVSWCAGKRRERISWLSCIWPVLNSSSPRSRFADKLLGPGRSELEKRLLADTC